MKSDREILRRIRELQSRRAPAVEEERVLEAVKLALRRNGRYREDAPEFGYVLRARLYLRNTSVGTLAVVLALLAGALLTVALTTSSETALARWITSVFGIGKPGGQPTLTSPIPSLDSAERHDEAASVVLGVTRLGPSGPRAELTAITTPRRESCIGFAIPSRKFHLSDCSRPTATRPKISLIASVRPAGLPGIVVLGTAPEGTRAVAITSPNRQDAFPTGSKTTIFDPSTEIRARAGVPGSVVYFAAHLVEPVPARLVAVARGAGGSPTARSLPASTGAVQTTGSSEGFVRADTP